MTVGEVGNEIGKVRHGLRVPVGGAAAKLQGRRRRLSSGGGGSRRRRVAAFLAAAAAAVAVVEAGAPGVSRSPGRLPYGGDTLDAVRRVERQVALEDRVLSGIVAVEARGVDRAAVALGRGPEEGAGRARRRLRRRRRRRRRRWSRSSLLVPRGVCCQSSPALGLGQRGGIGDGHGGDSDVPAAAAAAASGSGCRRRRRRRRRGRRRGRGGRRGGGSRRRVNCLV